MESLSEAGQWKMLDEDGFVQGCDLRDPRDGERYVVLLQDVEEEQKAKVEAKIKKFIAETGWRRHKSRYTVKMVEVGQSELIKRVNLSQWKLGFTGSILDIGNALSR
jgi:hypothetical protein